MAQRPRTLDEIDTPAVLIDVDRAGANIKRVQDLADRVGFKLRPHIKTHKLPHFAQLQMAAGAVGITCQKIGEAEVMADAGLTDIFLPYNILGAPKLARLAALHRRITLSVTADSAVTVDGLAEAFGDSGHPLPVLVECDTGLGRCGVQQPSDALVLAQRIDKAGGLSFGGLMTFPADGRSAEAGAWLSEARDLMKAEGLAVARISSGGTPNLRYAGGHAPATEYRPGSYIYLDRYQVSVGAGGLDDCALTVLATVVSRPTATRAILDAGSKALSSDTMGLSEFGELPGIPGALVARLSEEHGIVTLPEGTTLPIGARVRVLPDHACVVSNLFDHVHLISGDRVVDILPVAARGRLG